jgi:hypothetical protein
MIPSRWPRWTLIIIGLVLALLPIVVVLLLEPVSQAFAPAITPHRRLLSSIMHGPSPASAKGATLTNRPWLPALSHLRTRRTFTSNQTL